MKHWLLAVVLNGALAGGAYAESPLSFSAEEPQSTGRQRVNFRLVEDAVYDPNPIHNSGMIAQTQVAPNATLGIGILKAAPRKPGAGEWRVENGAPRSRKAAVSFRLRF